MENDTTQTSRGPAGLHPLLAASRCLCPVDLLSLPCRKVIVYTALPGKLPRFHGSGVLRHAKQTS